MKVYAAFVSDLKHNFRVYLSIVILNPKGEGSRMREMFRIAQHDVIDIGT
jgi:hypothetical protein